MTRWDKYYGPDIFSSIGTARTNNNNISRENGRLSSSKRTHPINIRYFFLADKIKKGEVKVAFCSTTNMLADFFAKPL